MLRREPAAKFLERTRPRLNAPIGSQEGGRGLALPAPAGLKKRPERLGETLGTRVFFECNVGWPLGAAKKERRVFVGGIDGDIFGPRRSNHRADFMRGIPEFGRLDGLRTRERCGYFPMQKVEKIRFRTSSGVVWPVRESRAHRLR